MEACRSVPKNDPAATHSSASENVTILWPSAQELTGAAQIQAPSCSYPAPTPRRLTRAAAQGQATSEAERGAKEFSRGAGGKEASTVLYAVEDSILKPAQEAEGAAAESSVYHISAHSLSPWLSSEESDKKKFLLSGQCERQSEHTEFPSVSCAGHECCHRPSASRCDRFTCLSSVDILQSFPALARPGTDLPYKCAACCNYYPTGEFLVCHVLQGVNGDFSCRVFYCKWKELRWKMYMKELRDCMADYKAQCPEANSNRQKRKQQGDSGPHSPAKRPFPEK